MPEPAVQPLHAGEERRVEGKLRQTVGRSLFEHAAGVAARRQPQTGIVPTKTA